MPYILSISTLYVGKRKVRRCREMDPKTDQGRSISLKAARCECTMRLMWGGGGSSDREAKPQGTRSARHGPGPAIREGKLQAGTKGPPC